MKYDDTHANVDILDKKVLMLLLRYIRTEEVMKPLIWEGMFKTFAKKRPYQNKKGGVLKSGTIYKLEGKKFMKLIFFCISRKS